MPTMCVHAFFFGKVAMIHFTLISLDIGIKRVMTTKPTVYYNDESARNTHQEGAEEDERNEVWNGDVEAAFEPLGGRELVAFLLSHTGQHDLLPTLARSAPVTIDNTEYALITSQIGLYSIRRLHAAVFDSAVRCRHQSQTWRKR